MVLAGQQSPFHLKHLRFRLFAHVILHLIAPNWVVLKSHPVKLSITLPWPVSKKISSQTLLSINNSAAVKLSAGSVDSYLITGVFLAFLSNCLFLPPASPQKQGAEGLQGFLSCISSIFLLLWWMPQPRQELPSPGQDSGRRFWMLVFTWDRSQQFSGARGC